MSGLRLQVEGAMGGALPPPPRGDSRLGSWPSTRVRCEGRSKPWRMRPVDAVLASDLGEQAAQLGGALHRGRAAWRHERSTGARA